MNVKIVRNDITNMEVDAIVLPANKMLKEGSGTSQAIYEKAGRAQLEKACRDHLKKHKNLWIGSAVLTPGFNLDAQYIIHAILPKWIDGNHDEYNRLSTAYFSALDLADMAGCETVAFPLLASGNNRFDLGLAFEIAMQSIDSFVPANKLEQVYLVLYGMRAVALAKERGFEVDEMIDTEYELRKDESYRNGVQRAAGHAVKAAMGAAGVLGNYAGMFVQDGLDMAQEYFDDPENRRRLIEQGVDVVKKAVAAQMAAARAVEQGQGK